MASTLDERVASSDWERWVTFLSNHLDELGKPADRVKMLWNPLHPEREVEDLKSLGISPQNLTAINPPSPESNKRSELIGKLGVRWVFTGLPTYENFERYRQTVQIEEGGAYSPQDIVKLSFRDPFNKEVNALIEYVLSRHVSAKVLFGLTTRKPTIADISNVSSFARSSALPSLDELCGVPYSNIPFKGNERLPRNFDLMVRYEDIPRKNGKNAFRRINGHGKAMTIDLKHLLEWGTDDFYLRGLFRHSSGESLGDFMFLDKYHDVLLSYKKEMIASLFTGKPPRENLIFKFGLPQSAISPREWGAVYVPVDPRTVLPVFEYEHFGLNTDLKSVLETLRVDIAPLLDSTAKRIANKAVRQEFSFKEEHEPTSRVTEAIPTFMPAMTRKGYDFLPQSTYDRFSPPMKKAVDWFRVSSSGYPTDRLNEVYKALNHSKWYLDPSMHQRNAARSFLNDVLHFVLKTDASPEKTVPALLKDTAHFYRPNLAIPTTNATNAAIYQNKTARAG